MSPLQWNKAVLTHRSNIGNDAIALWGHYDDSASSKFVQERQLMHVSILSVLSFVGRLCSGKYPFP